MTETEPSAATLARDGGVPPPRAPRQRPSRRACARLRSASALTGLLGVLIAMSGGVLLGLSHGAAAGLWIISVGTTLGAVALTLHWAGCELVTRRPHVADWIYHLVVAYVAVLFVLGAGSLALGSVLW